MSLGTEREISFQKFEWLGLFDDNKVIGMQEASPAQLLETILKEKLILEKEDKDMLVMYHEFEYTLSGKRYRTTSSMVNIGEDQIYTSMSNTVGLPVGIAAKMILTGNLGITGVTLPVQKTTYEPILEELREYGIFFSEKEELIG